MKKLLLLSMFTAFALGVYAKDRTDKTEDGKEIPYVAKKQFETDFKDAKNVVWSTSNLTQKASFILNDHKMSSYYDLNGKYLGTVQYVAYNNIPFRALKEVSQTYTGYSPTSVIQIADRPASSGYSDTGVYIVSLTNSKKEIQLQISPDGSVSLFKRD